MDWVKRPQLLGAVCRWRTFAGVAGSQDIPRRSRVAEQEDGWIQIIVSIV